MVYLSIYALIFVWLTIQPGECLTSEQVLFRRIKEKYLANHILERKQASSELDCGMHCVTDKSYASVNYKISGIGKGRCELNDKMLQGAADKEIHNPEFIHLAVVKRVSNNSLY